MKNVIALVIAIPAAKGLSALYTDWRIDNLPLSDLAMHKEELARMVTTESAILGIVLFVVIGLVVRLIASKIR